MNESSKLPGFNAGMFYVINLAMLALATSAALTYFNSVLSAQTSLLFSFGSVTISATMYICSKHLWQGHKHRQLANIPIRMGYEISQELSAKLIKLFEIELTAITKTDDLGGSHNVDYLGLLSKLGKIANQLKQCRLSYGDYNIIIDHASVTKLKENPGIRQTKTEVIDIIDKVELPKEVTKKPGRIISKLITVFSWGSGPVFMYMLSLTETPVKPPPEKKDLVPEKQQLAPDPSLQAPPEDALQEPQFYKIEWAVKKRPQGSKITPAQILKRENNGPGI